MRGQANKVPKKEKESVEEKEMETKESAAGHQPAYCLESRISDYSAVQSIYQKMLEVEVPKVTVKDLLSISGDLRKIVIENTRTQKAPTTGGVVATIPGVTIDFTMPL